MRDPCSTADNPRHPLLIFSDASHFCFKTTCRSKTHPAQGAGRFQSLSVHGRPGDGVDQDQGCFLTRTLDTRGRNCPSMLVHWAKRTRLGWQRKCSSGEVEDRWGLDCQIGRFIHPSMAFPACSPVRAAAHHSSHLVTLCPKNVAWLMGGRKESPCTIHTLHQTDGPQ